MFRFLITVRWSKNLAEIFYTWYQVVFAFIAAYVLFIDDTNQGRITAQVTAVDCDWHFHQHILFFFSQQFLTTEYQTYMWVVYSFVNLLLHGCDIRVSSDKGEKDNVLSWFWQVSNFPGNFLFGLSLIQFSRIFLRKQALSLSERIWQIFVFCRNNRILNTMKTATILTDKGTMKVEFYEKDAPNTVKKLYWSG